MERLQEIVNSNLMPESQAGPFANHLASKRLLKVYLKVFPLTVLTCEHSLRMRRVIWVVTCNNISLSLQHRDQNILQSVRHSESQPARYMKCCKHLRLDWSPIFERDSPFTNFKNVMTDFVVCLNVPSFSFIKK